MAVVAPFELDDFSRPVNARASRRALIVASVPEFTIRTISMDGTIRRDMLRHLHLEPVGAPKLVPADAARVTAPITRGCAWPRIIGPHDPT